MNHTVTAVTAFSGMEESTRRKISIDLNYYDNDNNNNNDGNDD